MFIELILTTSVCQSGVLCFKLTIRGANNVPETATKFEFYLVKEIVDRGYKERHEYKKIFLWRGGVPYIRVRLYTNFVTHKNGAQFSVLLA